MRRRPLTRPANHPGEILGDELAELGVTPNELAQQLGVPANRITQIVKGQRAITGDTAPRLGHWLETGAQSWLNLQTAYELRLAAQSAGRAIEKLPTREKLARPRKGGVTTKKSAAAYLLAIRRRPKEVMEAVAERAA